MKYVHRYHATMPPKYLTEEEAAKLGSEWSPNYIHQAYPKCKYHRTKAPVTVIDAEQEAALGAGWANGPGAFTEEAAVVTTARSEPLKWVDDWQVPGLQVRQRTKIKAQLLKAQAALFRSSSKDIARHAGPMQETFKGIAEVLFEAGMLTAELLDNEIPVLIWDSAIAGGWWGPASDVRTDGFPERLGHYWVWADHSKDQAGLFRAETAEWEGRLLEAFTEPSIPPTPDRISVVGAVHASGRHHAQRAFVSDAHENATGTPASEASGVKRVVKKVRRIRRYDAIDKALRKIAKMNPRRHDEVFENLQGRVSAPSAEPFHTAGGWVKGFQAHPDAARAWLSKSWSRLGLPRFPRGPK